jgi:hypothetical protein
MLKEAGGRTFHAAGWAGVIGFALSIFAAMFNFAGNRAIEQETAKLEQEAKDLSRHLLQAAPVELSRRQRLDRFYDAFPASISDSLVRLHGYAQARGVVLERASYSSAVEAGTELERVTIELPVHTTYPALRAWLADVLSEMPEIALLSMSIKRERSDVPELEARLQFAIFLRKRP